VTLRRDLERIVTLMPGSGADLDALVADGTERLRLYTTAFESVSSAHEAELLELVWRDPDRAMADSAVVGHVDRRAAAMESTDALVRWAAAVTGVMGAQSFPARRIQEWQLLRRVMDDATVDADDLAAASNWLQRKIVAEAQSTMALAALATAGRTKRLRNEAKSKAGRLRHTP
jgi:hypothetical protein